MAENRNRTVEMYVTHLGTNVLESVDINGDTEVILSTREDALKNPDMQCIGWDDEFGNEHVYDLNGR